jgi:hypothetical protein
MRNKSVFSKGEVQYKKRRRWWRIREISTQRLASPIWPPNWRMTGKRMSGNSLRPMTCRPERFMPLSWEWQSSQRSRPGRWKKMVFLGDEEGTIQDVWGGRSDGGRDSLTVWDNILTLWVAARGEERAGQPHSRSGGLLEELVWGYEKYHGGELRRDAPAIIRALPEVGEDRWRPYWQKLKAQNVATPTVFFYCDFPEIIGTHSVYVRHSPNSGLGWSKLTRYWSI